MRAGQPRYLPVADSRPIGPGRNPAQVAEPLAALFTKLDGHLPRPADWVDGPGGIKPDSRLWAKVAPEYAFVDEMAALRERIGAAATSSGSIIGSTRSAISARRGRFRRLGLLSIP